jgi:hypothetical protein
MSRSGDKRGVIVGKSHDGLVAYVHWDGNKTRDDGIAIAFLELENPCRHGNDAVICGVCEDIRSGYVNTEG